VATIIGRGFKISADQVIKLNPNAYSKRFVPPRKQTWQEKLVLSRDKLNQPIRRRKKGQSMKVGDE